jgi:glutamate-1-semialdehyde 2,1-aminomutase
MDFTCIIQARSNSKRFKNKIFKKINNKSILEIIIKRLKKSQKITNIIVSTTDKSIDNKVISLCNKLNIKYFRGSENNVLKRFFETSLKFEVKNIIRITADCPLVDWQTIDKMIMYFKNNNLDYLNNGPPSNFPDGLDVEIFKFKVLEKTFYSFNDKISKEHITTNIDKIPKIRKGNYDCMYNLSKFRWTLDEAKDLVEIKKIFHYFKNRINFTLSDINSAIIKKKLILPQLNRFTLRNEGSISNKYKKLWLKANQVIAGGNMLISKRPDRFSGDTWPTYFKKSKKIFVWDIFGKKYKDFSLMGVGTNILGYGNDEVNKEVKKVIQNGNMSTLNCYEEVMLAEKLISLHPWSDMAKFARSGGEANAIAIRLARASTGKEKVAVCGYHGWHDWYLSVDLNKKKKLNDLLFPGISMNGIPRGLKGSTIPFEYNDYKQIEKIATNNDLAAIKMEVQRNQLPKNKFLEKIRELCNKKKIILIFDECTSGFREAYGGLHLKHKVDPDIAIFGKALGNGYAISSIIGKKEVMSAEKNTFISSTFWTERIGYVAGLTTLKVMEKLKSWEIISKKGIKIKNIWKNCAKEFDLKIDITGLDAIPSFNFKSVNNEQLKIYFINQLLKKKYLSSSLVYLSTEHKSSFIDMYEDEVYDVFKEIKKFENEEKDINTISNINFKNFKRLN